MNKLSLILIFSFYISLLFSQNVNIENIDISNYPAIEVILETNYENELFKNDIKLFENEVPTDFVLDTVKIEFDKAHKIILFIIDLSDYKYYAQIVNSLSKSFEKIDNAVKINVLFFNADSIPDLLSAEFSSDFLYFKNSLMKRKNENLNSDTLINSIFLLKAIEFIDYKEIYSPNKNIILISDKNFKQNLDLDKCLELLIKYSITLNFFKMGIPSEKEIKNCLATNGICTNLDNTEFSISLDSVCNSTNCDEASYYRLTFISTQKTEKSELKINIKGTTIEKIISSSPESINLLKKNYEHLIRIILITIIIVITFLLISSKYKIRSLFKMGNYKQLEELQARNKFLEDKLAKYKSNKSFFIPEFKDFNPSLTLYSSGGEIPVIMIKNKDISKVFEISKPIITIGRIENNDLVINDAAISANHATLSSEGGEFFLIDNDSTNGTFVNDLKINKSKVKPNDIIRLGNTYLKLKF